MTSSSLVFLNLLVAAASQVTGEAHMICQWHPVTARCRPRKRSGGNWMSGRQHGRPDWTSAVKSLCFMFYVFSLTAEANGVFSRIAPVCTGAGARSGSTRFQRRFRRFRRVPRLPRKVKVDVAKRHARQAECRSMSPSATPATQTAAATEGPKHASRASPVP